MTKADEMAAAPAPPRPGLISMVYSQRRDKFDPSSDGNLLCLKASK